MRVINQVILADPSASRNIYSVYDYFNANHQVVQSTITPATRPSPSSAAVGAAALAPADEDDEPPADPPEVAVPVGVPRLNVGDPVSTRVVPWTLAVGTAGASVACTAFSGVPDNVAVTLAPGITVPLGMTTMLEVSVLSTTACARAAMLLSRSNTAYALRRKVSPKMTVPIMGGPNPKSHPLTGHRNLLNQILDCQ